MINNSPQKTRTYLTLIISVAVAPLLFSNVAIAGPKYKKNTVIDFEGALVEGKSRKPYSSYLSQEHKGGFDSLSNWKPDLRKKIAIQADKAKNQL